MELGEIDTPRDWPEHVREFLTLDQLLRCEICFKFFTNCMMTSCSHNFCSLCIRKHLSYKSTCPVCFKETLEPALKSNRLIDEVVIAFYNSRSKLIGTLQGTNVDEGGSWPNHRHKQIYKQDISDSITKVQSFKACQEKGNSQTESKTLSVSQPNKLLLPKRSYLPKRVYNIMKEKEIKDCLKKAGLSTKGRREDLVRRYKHYVIIYNAECDSENPRHVSELIKEVEEEERLRHALNTKSKKCFSTNPRSAPDDIERERKQYVECHTNDFQKLIAEIKNRNLDSIPDSESDSEVSILPSTSAIKEPAICVDISSDSESTSISTSNSNNHNSVMGNLDIVLLKEDQSLSESKLVLDPSVDCGSDFSDSSDKTLPLEDDFPPRPVKEDHTNTSCADDKHGTSQIHQLPNVRHERLLGVSQQNLKEAKETPSLPVTHPQSQSTRHRKRKTPGQLITHSDFNGSAKSSSRRRSLRKRNSPILFPRS